MEKRIGDNLIGNRWIVQGIYEFSQETNSWAFSADHRAGQVVWKFRKTGTLVAYLDGMEDYKVPFSIIYGILHLDLSSHKPDANYSGYKEAYFIEEKENGEVWLYDLETQRGDCYWLAIVIIPDK